MPVAARAARDVADVYLGAEGRSIEGLRYIADFYFDVEISNQESLQHVVLRLRFNVEIIRIHDILQALLSFSPRQQVGSSRP